MEGRSVTCMTTERSHVMCKAGFLRFSSSAKDSTEIHTFVVYAVRMDRVEQVLLINHIQRGIHLSTL
ncbi:hypothetical protein Y032_0151g2845 [Ancylostoma ceylanicum]|nr:hypothetical protein Y032_0151g2845 [Ancylostoma ceylanicum]